MRKSIVKKISCLAMVVTLCLASFVSVSAFYTPYGDAKKDIGIRAYGSTKSQSRVGTYLLTTAVPHIDNKMAVVDYYSGGTLASNSKTFDNVIGGYIYCYTDRSKIVTIFGTHQVRSYSAWCAYSALYGVES